MKLTDLLERLDYTCIQGKLDKEIKAIVNDSRKAVPDSLFFCIQGAVTDGHEYAAELPPSWCKDLSLSQRRLR